MPEKGKTFAGEVREETVAWSKDTYQLLKQAEQGKVKSYVQDIALAVLDCKETATSRETFIRLMNERGYGVDWQDSHKYITYTDLAREQAGEKACKIRDNKLEKYYNMDFGKESMEHEFERNARTAEAEQSKRAASRVKPTEPDRAGKQSAQRSVGDVERELRGIDEAVKSRTSEGRAEDTERRLCVPGPFREPYRGRGQPFQPGRCERRYKEAKDDLFLWYFEILEKNEIKIYPKKMTYNQMMEECKKNDIYIIKPLYSLGYTYNNNREDFKNYN